MPSKTVSILGCGWLGLPLAQALQRSGFQVKGSVATQENIPKLKQAGIAPYLIKCDPDIRGENLQEFFEADILVITIPFKRSFPDPSVYRKQINSVIKQLESSPIDFVIFTSSTSVYPDSLGLAVENATFEAQNKRADVLLKVEQDLLARKSFSATVIRFAGLYGKERKIGAFLAGKKDLPAGDQPVNLIHQDDCIEIIRQIIDQNIREEIFNACCDEHPTKRELYTKAAREMGLEPPSFAADVSAGKRIVSSKKLKDRLHYKFQHPDPMTGLNC